MYNLGTMRDTRPRREPKPKDLRPTPAPGRLKLVQDFVNTLDREGELDQLRTPDGLTVWLARRRLMPSMTLIDESAWRGALEVRAGLHALLRANSGLPLDEEALERLNRVLEDALFYVHFKSDGEIELATQETGWTRALVKMIDIIVWAQAVDGPWKQLKTCANERCQRAFYDSSGTGKWCNVRRCGGRKDGRAEGRGPRRPQSPFS